MLKHASHYIMQHSTDEIWHDVKVFFASAKTLWPHISNIYKHRCLRSHTANLEKALVLSWQKLYPLILSFSSSQLLKHSLFTPWFISNGKKSLIQTQLTAFVTKMKDCVRPTIDFTGHGLTTASPLYFTGSASKYIVQSPILMLVILLYSERIPQLKSVLLNST